MAYILVIYTVIASMGYTRLEDWRPIGDFKSESSCQEAAYQLNASRFKCLKK